MISTAYPSLPPDSDGGTISTVGGLIDRDLGVGHEFLAKARQAYHGRNPTAHGRLGPAARDWH
jgi:hypothetical protein